MCDAVLVHVLITKLYIEFKIFSLFFTWKCLGGKRRTKHQTFFLRPISRVFLKLEKYDVPRSKKFRCYTCGLSLLLECFLG